MHHFLEEHIDVKSLANSINDIFVDLTNDFEPLTPYVPEDLLATQQEVYRALSSIPARLLDQTISQISC